MGCLTTSHHGVLSQEMTVTTPQGGRQKDNHNWLGVEKEKKSMDLEINFFENQMASNFFFKLKMALNSLSGNGNYYIKFPLITYDFGGITLTRSSKN